MATVTHLNQYWTLDIPPGGSATLQWGPSEDFRRGTVQVMCSPDPFFGPDALRGAMTLVVPEVRNRVTPFLSGSFWSTRQNVEFTIFNRGPYAVRNFYVTVTTINA
jgi:hypothetical protein